MSDYHGFDCYRYKIWKNIGDRLFGYKSLSLNQSDIPIERNFVLWLVASHLIILRFLYKTNNYAITHGVS